MKTIRAGSGLGDSIYLRPIVEHYVRAGEQMTALSNWPDVFIDSGAQVLPFERRKRDGNNLIAHYTSRKHQPETTQFQDMLGYAGIEAAVPLEFTWRVRNSPLIADLRAQARGRPIILAHGGREPMGRTDGFGMELLPKRSAFDTALLALQECFIVGVGSPDGQKYPLKVDLNLAGKTSVADLLDIAWSCDGVVAQCSFAVPLAECFNKPLLAVWAARVLTSTTPFIQAITPGKILSKRTSCFVWDDWTDERIREGVRAFRDL